MQQNSITPRSEDYSQWYTDVIQAAELADHTPVRGCMVIKPYGFALWERIQSILDPEFKSTGVQNAYFPMLIPERLLNREKDHVEGFAPEVAVVTHAGNEELEERLVIRPTSETIMYEIMKDWVQSYRDLPILINQWTNVVRWEKRTRMFLRTTEFLWQEGHTIHATFDEADQRARQMLEVYRDCIENHMAIAGVAGVKPEHEKFAGAHKTYTIETIMQDGKALQICTSHNLSDHFAKAFEISYLNANGEHTFAYQTSWGLSTRSIGGLVMTHSDDSGLMLPPKMASIPVVVVPIYASPEDQQLVMNTVDTVMKPLGYRIDDRDYMRPGEKYYEWERKGVPIRIEIGPKDIAKNACMVVRRDTGEKKSIPLETLQEEIQNLLETIQQDVYKKSKDRLLSQLVTVDSWEDFIVAIESGKAVLAHWDETTETAEQVKTETAATIRCIPFDAELRGGPGVCIKTGKPSSSRVLFAKNY
jgi:prolyl-tRNA synthetase